MGRLQRLRLFQVYPETENFEIAPDSRLGPNETRLNDRLAIRTISPGKLICTYHKHPSKTHTHTGELY